MQPIFSEAEGGVLGRMVSRLPHGSAPHGCSCANHRKLATKRGRRDDLDDREERLKKSSKIDSQISFWKMTPGFWGEKSCRMTSFGLSGVGAGEQFRGSRGWGMNRGGGARCFALQRDPPICPHRSAMARPAKGGGTHDPSKKTRVDFVVGQPTTQWSRGSKSPGCPNSKCIFDPNFFKKNQKF